MAVPGKIRQGGVDGGGSNGGGGGGEWGRQGNRQTLLKEGKAVEKKLKTRWKAGMSAFCFFIIWAVWRSRWLSSLRRYYWQLLRCVCACMCILVLLCVCVCECTWCSKTEREKVWTPVPQYLHVYVRLTSLAPNLGKIGHCGISFSEKLKLETKGFLSGERSPGLAASSPSSDSSK